MELRNKKAAFFSSDALIALIIILIVILAVRPLSDYVQPDTEIHSDILSALSTLRVSELEDSTVQSMISSGQIRYPNKTLLEQIGEFYVYNITNAKLLASIALKDLNTSENVGIWYEDELIFSTNHTPFEKAKDIDVARRVLSGIQAGQNITGFSARAGLASNYRTNYFYFGGYVGDGNVSVLLDYQGNITDQAEMEIAINTTDNNFEFYINGQYQGDYATSPSPLEPVRYTFDTGNFSSGKNLLEFKGENLYIAGGFVKVTYRGEVQFGNKDNTYFFPGINGLVNLYDGFFVPSNLTAMDILLHLDSNYTMLLKIGNITVFNDTTNGAENITFDNAFLSGILDYGEMEGKTIPLRLGLKNASFIGIVQKIDVFSVTDLSGSMDDNCGGSWYCNEVTCTQPGCSDANGCKICDAKDANYLLIDYILNTTGNRVGLVGYESGASSSDYHPLSNDSSSLYTEVGEWDADGSTCICCGIDEAILGFLEGRNSDLFFFYDFDNNLDDHSEIGYDGTIMGNPNYVPGQEGSGMEFDGIDDYVSARNIRVGDQGTIAFWFRLNEDFGNSETTTQGIWSKILNDDNDAFIALRGSDMSGGDGSDGTIQVKMESNGATYVATTTDSWTADQWYHLALTWDGSTTRIYVNGTEENSDGSSRTLEFWANNTFGRADFESYNLNGPRFLNGTLDDFRMYNQSLGPSEIQDLMDLSPNCQDGTVQIGEACDDGNNESDDGCTPYCEIEFDRYKSMVVMSDGEATRGCTGNHNDAIDAQEAIDMSKEACEIYDIVVHSVGFAVSPFGESTLTSIANNGCGGQYYYSDTTNLTEVYKQIAEEILTEYFAQTLSASSSGINTRLYPDSYIKFNYTEPSYPYGLTISAESQFDAEYGGTFFIPNGSVPLFTSVVSYSGPEWTSEVLLNNQNIFNLDDYGQKYTFLGDPYQVSSLDSIVSPGINYANVSTGVSSTNKSYGSEFNKIIYTIGRNASSYSSVVALARGCNWDIQMEDNTYVSNLPVPETYTGSDECFYDTSSIAPSPPNPPNTYGNISNDDDAYQLAVLNLLRELDLNKNGKSDVFFTEQDLAIDVDEFSGIPFAYYSEVEVRRWI